MVNAMAVEVVVAMAVKTRWGKGGMEGVLVVLRKFHM